MKLLKLRQKANRCGLVIEEILKEGFLIHNAGVKQFFSPEIHCKDIEEVERVLNEIRSKENSG